MDIKIQTKKYPKIWKLTSSIQFLYFSVIGICSSIADPWLVFQLPVIDLRLKWRKRWLQKLIYKADTWLNIKTAIKFIAKVKNY